MMKVEEIEIKHNMFIIYSTANYGGNLSHWIKSKTRIPPAAPTENMQWQQPLPFVCEVHPSGTLHGREGCHQTLARYSPAGGGGYTTYITILGQRPCNLTSFSAHSFKDSIFKQLPTVPVWIMFFGPILKAHQNGFSCAHKPIHLKILQKPPWRIPSGWLSKTGFVLTGEQMEWDDKGQLGVFLSCEIRKW